MKLGAKHEDGWLDIFTFYVLDQDTGGELAWTCGHITGCCDQGTGRVTGRHQSESSSVHVLTLPETHKDETQEPPTLPPQYTEQYNLSLV